MLKELDEGCMFCLLVVSSAMSMLLLCFMHFGMLFMYIRNNMRPTTFPWATPDVTGILLEELFSKTTVICVDR
jgi:hypothetical protein